MSGERERLIPVRSESDLRVGMLVQFRSCFRCGRNHRYMLLAPAGHVERVDCGIVNMTKAWSTAPASCRQPDRSYDGLVTFARTIREGRLFRVDTGRDDEDEQERRRDYDLKLAKDRSLAKERQR